MNTDQDTQTAQIVRLYNQGLSLRAVGAIVGLSHEAVGNRLRQAEVTRRGHPHNSKLPPGKTYADIAAEHALDGSKALASIYGVDERTISRWVAKAAH